MQGSSYEESQNVIDIKDSSFEENPVGVQLDQFCRFEALRLRVVPIVDCR